MDSATAQLFAIAWGIFCAACLVHSRNIGSRFWAGLGVLSAFIASVRGTAWNVDLWQWVRHGMQDAGVYGERYWYKAAIGVLLCGGGIAIGRLAWRGLKMQGRGTRVATAAASLLFFFITWMTASLDFVLPGWFISGPVRLVFESLLPLAAFAGLVSDWREYEAWPEGEGSIPDAAPAAKAPPRFVVEEEEPEVSRPAVEKRSCVLPVGAWDGPDGGDDAWTAEDGAPRKPVDAKLLRAKRSGPVESADGGLDLPATPSLELPIAVAEEQPATRKRKRPAPEDLDEEPVSWI